MARAARLIAERLVAFGLAQRRGLRRDSRRARASAASGTCARASADVRGAARRDPCSTPHSGRAVPAGPPTATASAAPSRSRLRPRASPPTQMHRATRSGRRGRRAPARAGTGRAAGADGWSGAARVDSIGPLRRDLPAARRGSAAGAAGGYRRGKSAGQFALHVACPRQARVAVGERAHELLVEVVGAARTDAATRCSYSTRARAISPPSRVARSRSRRPATTAAS